MITALITDYHREILHGSGSITGCLSSVYHKTLVKTHESQSIVATKFNPILY